MQCEAKHHYQVVIAGAGPVGLTLALELGWRGILVAGFCSCLDRFSVICDGFARDSLAFGDYRSLDPILHFVGYRIRQW